MKKAGIEVKSMEIEKEKRKEKDDLETIDAHDAEIKALNRFV
jgi:hypothetical protein